MEQDPEQTGKDDDKASVGGASGLDFNFQDEDETETVSGTSQPAQDEISSLKLLSAFMNTNHNFYQMTHQENNDEVLYLFRAWKGTGRSRLVIKKNNDMKMKFGSKIMLRKLGKTKVDSEPPAKTASSAK